MLTPVEIVGKKNNNALWRCKCDCGGEIDVMRKNLVQGFTKTCGNCGHSTKPKELIGQRFGMLVAIEPVENEPGKRTKWLCRCDCGNTSTPMTLALTQGRAKSCGCQTYQESNEDIIGQTFGRLTVISKFEKQKEHWMFLCRCACGKEHFTAGYRLRGGNVKSCGCLTKEINSKRAKTLLRELNPRWRGGIAIDNDFRKTKEYSDWRRAVLKRDKRTCQCCGDTKDLEAHHLESYINNEALRASLDNGICLCQTCHTVFHMENGYGDNTAQQFEMWRAKIIGGEAPSV